MKKEIFADSLILGSGLMEQPFYLLSISPLQGFRLQSSVYDGFMLELQDRTGRIYAFVPNGVVSDIGTLLNTVVSISGIVLKPSDYVIKVSAIEACETYRPYDVIMALSDKRKRQYTNLIRGMIDNIHEHPKYKMLLEAIYTDEYIEQAAMTPVSLRSYGNYCGAVLAATASIVDLSISYVKMMNELLNEIYQQPIDVEIVLTAALLQYVGKVREYTVFPFKRTEEAICVGRTGVLQNAVFDAIKLNNLDIETSEVSEILSYVLPSLDPKGQVKAITKEGTVLQKITEAYIACDMRDKVVADYVGEEEIFFSPQLNQYCRNTNRKAG